ncbi:MAG TPA: hypothetical protein VEW94_07085 [Chloroflexia bacterium]|nr:hypothetical protein [Chloroflexia bacterium]
MIIQNEADEKGATVEPPTVLLYCTDLMFGVQLQNMARAAGLRYLTARPNAPLPAASMMVVDLAARGDWEGAIREAVGRGVKVVAFGPHMDAESRRRAKEAGASRVLANSNLTRDLPGILAELSS